MEAQNFRAKTSNEEDFRGLCQVKQDPRINNHHYNVKQPK